MAQLALKRKDDQFIIITSILSTVNILKEFKKIYEWQNSVSISIFKMRQSNLVFHNRYCYQVQHRYSLQSPIHHRFQIVVVKN